MRAALVLTALLCAAPALARDSEIPLHNGLSPVQQADRWGVGFMLGDPFGLTAKHYGAHPFDLYAGLAYAPGVRFGGDWLWNLGRLEHHPKFDLDLYLGVGPFLGFFSHPCGWGFDKCNGDVYFGARVPFGIELTLREVPVAFGLELAPGLAFAPGDVGGILDFLLSLRFLL